MKTKNLDELADQQSIFAAAARRQHLFLKTTPFADISCWVVWGGGGFRGFHPRLSMWLPCGQQESTADCGV
jgi:hypothetical protein